MQISTFTTLNSVRLRYTVYTAVARL